ncbi:uncharacterized protein BDZ99DRAFT_136387 [Mytilinidion resinicola]|uniref:RING-type domain-containing protein n=1 Tax=Mytilinidion resinicola TaxID=574789 RepID=A0A6A6Z709_9PEZI|nr:uncharacterized protein BDZ99DRAFT_136387 [Mytilinidion resinicola]KAF2816453.1 hypothetical protein BDZ99DRAFT_136387 [Mytilinidion resinicola]
MDDYVEAAAADGVEEIRRRVWYLDNLYNLARTSVRFDTPENRARRQQDLRANLNVLSFERAIGEALRDFDHRYIIGEGIGRSRILGVPRYSNFERRCMANVGPLIRLERIADPFTGTPDPDEMDQTRRCNICFDDYTADDPGMQLRRCGHIACGPCLSTVFNDFGFIARRCPFCRIELFPIARMRRHPDPAVVEEAAMATFADMQQFRQIVIDGFGQAYYDRSPMSDLIDNVEHLHAPGEPYFWVPAQRGWYREVVDERGERVLRPESDEDRFRLLDGDIAIDVDIEVDVEENIENNEDEKSNGRSS